MWRIFSYLTAVAAGILAFGRDAFPGDSTNLLLLCGSFLVFWFWAAFLPLDKYGAMTLQRLVDIEALLNEKYKLEPKVCHFTAFQTRKLKNQENQLKEKGLHALMRAITFRTSSVVFVLVGIVNVVWAFFFVRALYFLLCKP